LLKIQQQKHEFSKIVENFFKNISKIQKFLKKRNANPLTNAGQRKKERKNILLLVGILKNKFSKNLFS